MQFTYLKYKIQVCLIGIHLTIYVFVPYKNVNIKESQRKSHDFTINLIKTINIILLKVV